MNLSEILANVRAAVPLVHCITNYVTVNDCANILLACGGSPIMADDEAEVEEIAALASALVLNIGTLNSRTVESMRLAGKTANSRGCPAVLDPVGAGASRLRTETTGTLLQEVRFAVIRGNSSEVAAIARGSGTTRGVDADAADALTQEGLPEAARYAKDLSARTGAVIAITGAIDLIADAQRAVAVYNGHPALSRITGTGCMLSALTGAFVGANPARPLEAAVAAVCAMGLCGETAQAHVEKTGGGTGSFRIALIDAVSALEPDTLQGGARFACL